MRHRLAGRKLNRPTPHRKALLRNQVKDLLVHESIRTTEARAKETRRLAERMITLGKDGSLHARRQALRFLNTKSVVAKVFDEIAPRYTGRAGGYTRILKLGRRDGDGAAMAQLELVAQGE
ncbi:MAG: 50S ribosomal protein L17 [Dehalococcoidia bacterium]|nr:50S ribosomal protein L17 [Dehalococcoidia bacterium]